jgi:hypothetical protein
MIVLQPNKKRREPGEQCHAWTMMHREADKTLKKSAHHVPLIKTLKRSAHHVALFRVIFFQKKQSGKKNSSLLLTPGRLKLMYIAYISNCFKAFAIVQQTHKYMSGWNAIFG